MGTKTEDLKRHGQGGYFASHDLEDFITVVDGSKSLLDEIEVVSVELRRFVGETVAALLTEPYFLFVERVTFV